jgi:hypothetical protein
MIQIFIFIALFVLLIGIIIILGRILSPSSNQNNNQPKPLQFSIARLLTTTTIVAIVFGIARIGNTYRFDNFGEVFIISIIAISLGAIPLIYKKNDIKGIIFIICIFILFYMFIGVVEVINMLFRH